MIWWLWVLLGILLLAIELLTPGGFYVIFFAGIGWKILAGLGLLGLASLAPLWGNGNFAGAGNDG